MAMAACHDAIRKAFVAHMSANGLRVRGGEGAHRVAIEYARNEIAGLDQDDLVAVDEIRRDRALAEYGDFASRQLSAEHVRQASDVAERVVDRVAGQLAR